MSATGAYAETLKAESTKYCVLDADHSNETIIVKKSGCYAINITTGVERRLEDVTLVSTMMDKADGRQRDNK